MPQLQPDTVDHLPSTSSRHATQIVRDIQAIERTVLHGHFDQAMVLVEQLLSPVKDPGHRLFLAGMCHLVWQKFPQSWEYFSQLERLLPHHKLVTQALACVLVRLGRMPDALYYHKLTLSFDVPSASSSSSVQYHQVWQQLNDEFCDFHAHLALWRENICLLNAHRAWREGDVDSAIRQLQQSHKVRDPQAQELYTLYDWLMLSARVHDALKVTVELNQFHGQTPYHQLLAAEALYVLGSYEALQQTLPQALNSTEPDEQLRALVLAQRSLSLGGEVIGQTEIDARVAHFWEQEWVQMGKSTVSLPSLSGTAEEQVSVGILIDNFHANSPTVWLLPLFKEIVNSKAKIILYVEQADHWGMHALEECKADLVYTDDINDMTLQTIIRRNQHQVLWCTGGFGGYQRMRMLLKSQNRVVGLLWDQRHLATSEHAGFWRIINQERVENVPTMADILVVDQPVMRNSMGLRQPGHFIIALALRPYQLTACVSLLQGLLALPGVVLSFDSDLLGDMGKAQLAALLSESDTAEAQDDDEKVFLHAPRGYLDPNHVEKHLHGVDCYLSSGTPVYDRAALSIMLPSVMIPPALSGTPARLSEDFDLMRGIIARGAQVVDDCWCPADAEALLCTIEQWLEPEQWHNAQLDFARLLDHLSEPIDNMQALLYWVDRFIVSGNAS